MDIFGDLVSYHGNGDKDNKIPHIKYNVNQNGQQVTKIIYIIGYDNKHKWKKALGSQFGCGFIDEINIADYEFVQESTMRCKYWMSTMNSLFKPDLNLIARDVLSGKYGNGQARIRNLRAGGYNPDEVQAVVNQLLAA